MKASKSSETGWRLRRRRSRRARRARLRPTRKRSPKRSESGADPSTSGEGHDVAADPDPGRMSAPSSHRRTWPRVSDETNRASDADPSISGEGSDVAADPGPGQDVGAEQPSPALVASPDETDRASGAPSSSLEPTEPEASAPEAANSPAGGATPVVTTVIAWRPARRQRPERAKAAAASGRRDVQRFHVAAATARALKRAPIPASGREKGKEAQAARVWARARQGVFAAAQTRARRWGRRKAPQDLGQAEGPRRGHTIRAETHGDGRSDLSIRKAARASDSA